MHARCVFISKLNCNTCCYDIGILNDEYQYFQYSTIIKSQYLTYTCIKSFNQLFNAFSIDKNTNISILDTITKTDILYLYLFIIKQQTQVNLKFVNLDMLPRRIAAYHITYLGNKKSSKISKYMLSKLWNKLVELEKCPWITTDVDEQLKNTTNILARRNKVLRIGLYYMIIKKFLVDKAKKYKTKNKSLDM